MKDISNHVIPLWAPKWKQLGTQLGLQEHVINNIEHNPPHDSENHCRNMFAKWLEMNVAASWADVISAVDNVCGK